MRSLMLTALLLLLTRQPAHAEATRLAPEQLGQDGRITLTPGFTPDGNTMYFAQSSCTPIWACPQTLKKSTRTKTGWSAAEDVRLPADGRVDWPNVSPDGETLVFAWSARRDDLATLDIRENFDLYTLDLTSNAAVPLPIMDGDINRPRAGSLKTLRYMHNEAYPSLTNTGALYFMTERPDGIGERDIYVSRMGENGVRQVAVPVAGPVNSLERDDGVWVNASETLMLLTYTNRGGAGDADLFVSRKTSSGWSEPVNLGDEFNTPYAEFGAKLTPNGNQIVFTSDRPFADQPRGLLQVWVADFDLE
ncbi:MAG: hypothetical protein AAF270_13175, partial [Pseudomonadota bacterium]